MSDSLDAMRRWNRNLADLIDAAGAAGFPERLLGALSEFAGADPPSLAFVFRAGRAPEVCCEHPPPTPVRLSIDRYLDGAFVLDPCYRAGRDGAASGFYRLRDLAPAGFRQSPYYRNYFARSGLLDEIGYIVPIGDGGFVNLSLSRVHPPLFPATVRALLETVAPPVMRLAERHWGGQRDGDHHPAGERVEQVLSEFGAGRLTAREREVLQLVLRGHSVKSAARALEVSVDTIKLHRRNVYAKLGVASQAQLLAWVVAELSGSSAYPTG